MTIAALRNSEGQFSGNSAQKDRREHCKTPWWRCWFNGSQPSWWRWKFGSRNNTNLDIHLRLNVFSFTLVLNWIHFVFHLLDKFEVCWCLCLSYNDSRHRNFINHRMHVKCSAFCSLVYFVYLLTYEKEESVSFMCDFVTVDTIYQMVVLKLQILNLVLRLA